MSAGPSKSQIDRLGLRLVGEDEPADADLDLLHQLLLARSEQLDGAEVRVREGLGIVPTSRMKNTETILEKLRRSGGSGLKSVQDLAGMRIVGDFDRQGQDELVERIVVLFGDDDRPPKVVDRRAEPMYGYRAVHVIVFPEDAPIEVQVRTEWQHEWAEFFEKLADLVGRGIRYGEPPARRPDTPGPAGEAVAGIALELLQTEREARQILVDMARIAADLIDIVEVAEANDSGQPRLDDYRRDVARVLDELRGRLAEMQRVTEAIGRL